MALNELKSLLDPTSLLFHCFFVDFRYEGGFLTLSSSVYNKKEGT